MTESLFDTKFTTEEGKGGKPDESKKQADITDASSSASTDIPTTGATTGAAAANIAKTSSGEHDTESTTLPSIDNTTPSSALINYRVLVSAKEAGCLIGQNGSVINSIREVTNTKAGISKLQNGSHERILTVSGTLDDCSKALSYFAQALCNSSSENLTNYNFFPLKQLSSIPCIEGKTTILRLLIPNLQMGTLIGSKGLRIQQIQSKFEISMIASKLFLPNSNERLVELQGSVDNLYESLRIISRCLIEDFSSIVGTNYYIPKGYKKTGDRSGPGSSSSSTGAPSSSEKGGPHNGKPNSSLVSTQLPFANDIVGALIGKSGSRIQGVRKVSGATIAISDEVEGLNERVFTISGTSYAVEKAKDLLYHNLEREEQRRAEMS